MPDTCILDRDNQCFYDCPWCNRINYWIEEYEADCKNSDEDEDND